jgi:hypothetical protein
LRGFEIVAFPRAASHDQKEETPHLGAHFLHQLCNLRQVRHVAPRNRGLELGIQADIAGVPQRRHGAVEGPGNAAKIVVAGGVVAVHADGHPRHSRFFEAIDGFRRQQGRGARCHVRAKPDFGAVPQKLV